VFSSPAHLPGRSFRRFLVIFRSRVGVQFLGLPAHKGLLVSVFFPFEKVGAFPPLCAFVFLVRQAGIYLFQALSVPPNFFVPTPPVRLHAFKLEGHFGRGGYLFLGSPAGGVFLAFKRFLFDDRSSPFWLPPLASCGKAFFSTFLWLRPFLCDCSLRGGH